MAASTARERNALRVLDYLFREGPARRVDLIRATALSRATVSKLIGELQAQRLVVEQGPALTAGGRSGRPPGLLTLNPEIGAFGGVDFGHSSVRVAIADVTGTLVAEDRLDLDVDNAAELAITAAVERLPALVSQAGLARKRLLGVGAAISAPVRRDGASVVTAGILPGWSAVSPQRELTRRLGVPVHVGNDANLGALAEWTFGVGRGADDLIYLMLSDGVGAGLILNGRPYEGAAGAAGELGHVTVVDGGYVCRCGNRGCLETVVGTRALVGALAHSRGPDTTLADVVALAVAGDPGCLRVIVDAGRTVGRALSGVCAVLDPKLVVVGGRVAAVGAPLLDGVREVLDRRLPQAISQGVVVTTGRLGDRAEVLGAVALATRRTSAHLLTP
jgi:predicted NBD/HSP70 family sugar kinase